MGYPSLLTLLSAKQFTTQPTASGFYLWQRNGGTDRAKQTHTETDRQGETDRQRQTDREKSEKSAPQKLQVVVAHASPCLPARCVDLKRRHGEATKRNEIDKLPTVSAAVDEGAGP